MRGFLVPFVLLLLAAPAAAEDVLALKGGKLAVGRIEALTENGVVLASETGRVEYPWNTLTRMCEYEVRSDHLKPDDAAGRVALAEFCIRNGLYPYARRELATARGLGFPDGARLDTLEAEAARAEEEETFARVEQLVAEEDFEGALAEIRRYLLVAPPAAEGVARARATANDLLRRIDSAKLAAEEQVKADAATAAKDRLAKDLEALRASVAKHRETAGKSHAEGLKFDEIGNRTRARKAWEAAIDELTGAWRDLSKIQRKTGRGAAYDKAEEEKREVRKKLVEIYLSLAAMYVRDRNYKTGVSWVNKALYLDPVNEDALALRKEIDENRITRSLRGLTNTPGVRTTGPGGVTTGGR